MKFLAIALLLCSAQAFAEIECSSIWVYKPYKTCANPANGLDLSQPGTAAQNVRQWSHWLPGGRNQSEVCQDIRDQYNKDNLEEGLHAEMANSTPLHEQSEKRLVIQEYKYECRLSVLKYPFKSAPNPVCGNEDKYSYKIGGTAADLPGSATCLSCDDLADQPPESTVDCLHQNITEIIEPKAVDLRESDVQAVTNRVTQILTLNKLVPINNLRSIEQLSFFADFLTKHPGTENQNESPGHGLRDRPKEDN